MRAGYPCKTRWFTGVLFALVLALTYRAHAQNGSPFRDWKPAAWSESNRLGPKGSCATLVSLTGYEYSVLSATLVHSTANSPEFCDVIGLVAPEIRFEVALPTSWNGRFYMFGNGGFAGEALDAPARVRYRNSALAAGFAVAQTNTGHDARVEPLGTFAVNSQKLADWGFRAVHITAVTSKRITQAYYDSAARRSYFDGCSTGGRQGLTEAQRFPDDFDGIAVGAPALDRTTVIAGLWNQRALARAPTSLEKLKVVADRIYAKCDAVDGVADGIIDDPRRCDFVAARDVPQCAAGVDGPTCLTAAQIQTFDTIYRGMQSNGTTAFPGQLVGSEIAAPKPANGVEPGWVGWLLPRGTTRGNHLAFGETALKYIAFGVPNPNYDWTTFDFDKDLARAQAASSWLDAKDSDLTRFKSHGGKILMYHGWADPALNPLMTVTYFDEVRRRFGAATDDFVRLFMVPGMFHCNGGVGVDTFDPVTPLVTWTEIGTAPTSIIGSHVVDGKTARTRPLCPYPQTAQYKNSGSIDEAANFVCRTPPSDEARR